jgi:transposase-like protein
MARMEIITGPERRRSWCEEQKRAIVAAVFAPGAIVADVVRRAAVCAGQIYRWRQELGDTGSGFPQSRHRGDGRRRQRSRRTEPSAGDRGRVWRCGSRAHRGVDAA